MTAWLKTKKNTAAWGGTNPKTRPSSGASTKKGAEHVRKRLREKICRVNKLGQNTRGVPWKRKTLLEGCASSDYWHVAYRGGS